MEIAETVTFGTSGLDRAAHLRGDADALTERRKSARAILLWRGKVLLENQTTLVRLDMTHPVLKSAVLPEIFLGLDEGHAVFAYDISAWEPDGQEQEHGFVDPTEQVHPDLDDGTSFCEMRMVLTKLSRRDAELAVTAKAVLGWHHTHGFCAKCGAKSEIVLAGWQRSCAACGAQHFPRTDPVVIMLVTSGNKTLLGRSPGWPEGMYSCLAGFVEPGETIEAAVRRETFEEAGITIGRVTYLSSQPWPYPSSLMFGCHGEALDETLKIDISEIENALWVTREELVQAFAGEHPSIKPARRGSIAHFLLENWLADRLD